VVQSRFERVGFGADFEPVITLEGL